jgi:hypothetical protein
LHSVQSPWGGGSQQQYGCCSTSRSWHGYGTHGKRHDTLGGSSDCRWLTGHCSGLLPKCGGEEPGTWEDLG